MAPRKKPTPEPAAQPFSDWLTEQNKGTLHDELTRNLHDLVEAVLDTNRAGYITLSVRVAPRKGESGRVVITDRVTAKLPERRSTLYFVDEEGNLSGEAPGQLSIVDAEADEAPGD